MKYFTAIIIAVAMTIFCSSCGKEVKGLKEEIKALKEENSYLKAENIGLKKEIEELYKKIEEKDSIRAKDLSAEKEALKEKEQTPVKPSKPEPSKPKRSENKR